MRLIQCDKGKILINERGTYHLEKLAEGGSAFLFRGVPININGAEGEPPRPLTFKFLRPELVKRKATYQHFKEECELLQRLQCSGIPALVDYELECAKPYLAYCYIEGISVLKLLRAAYREGVAPSVAVKIVQALLKILDYLYRFEEPLAHGDISPDNLILSCTGNVALIDLGCVRYLNRAGDHPWLGKPSYLSPEQAKAMPWDQRSDLYQAGIVFYELLTGRKYNAGTHLRECALLSANPPPKNLKAEVPALSPELEYVLQKLLAVAVRERFQTAEEALAALAPFSVSP